MQEGGPSPPNRRHAATLCLLLACTVPHIAGLATGDRSGAFIGYSEGSGYGHCQDKLPSCEKESSMNKCITDPYIMRRFCPVSCSVSPCVNTGTVLESFVFRGFATPTGTAAYASSLQGVVAINHFSTVTWGRQAPGAKDGSSTQQQQQQGQQQGKQDSIQQQGELQLSSLGLGTYLGLADDATDEAVLSAVLYSTSRGWNVIDTAANYRNGRAESAIGKALSLLLVGPEAAQFPADRAEVTRDGLFISTKAGFLNAGLKQQLLDQGAASAADIMGGAHCLTRACIRASVQASLTKLRLATLDLVYLHNPAEVQLLPLGRQAFMAVLRNAFAELEVLRQEGKLRGYGLATWDCFRQPPGGSVHLNLEEVVALAREIGGTAHGFMAIQLPINAKMTEAFSQPWQQVKNEAKTAEAAAAAAQAAAAAAAQAAAVAEAARLQAELANAPGGAVAVDGEANAEGAAAAPAASPPPPVPPPPPPLPPPVVFANVTVMEAAAQLGVAVFASGPLMESKLLQGVSGPLDHILGLRDAPSTATKLLQYVRGVKGVASVLLGQKAQEHVQSNVKLAGKARLTDKMWVLVSQQVTEALQAQEELHRKIVV